MPAGCPRGRGIQQAGLGGHAAVGAGLLLEQQPAVVCRPRQRAAGERVRAEGGAPADPSRTGPRPLPNGPGDQGKDLDLGAHLGVTGIEDRHGKPAAVGGYRQAREAAGFRRERQRPQAARVTGPAQRQPVERDRTLTRPARGGKDERPAVRSAGHHREHRVPLGRRDGSQHRTARGRADHSRARGVPVERRGVHGESNKVRRDLGNKGCGSYVTSRSGGTVLNRAGNGQ